MPAELAPPTQDDRLGSADAPGRSRTRLLAAPGAALAHAVLLALLAWFVVPHGVPVRLGSISMVLTREPGAAPGVGPPPGLLAMPASPSPPSAIPSPMLPLPPIDAPPAAPRLPQPLAAPEPAAPRRVRSRPRGSPAASARAQPQQDGGLPAGAGAVAGPSSPMQASASRGTQGATRVGSAPGGSALGGSAPGGLALGGLATAIDQAIREAAIMPEAARRQHREGRVLARFSYLDGAVRDPAILQSSHSQLLDDAALMAVRQARCPAPPAGLAGHRLDLVVWIDFHVSPS